MRSTYRRIKLGAFIFFGILVASPLTKGAPTAAPKLPPIAAGPFKPDWNSLTNYQCPEWFRNAKFGIWAHWTPQCQPEHGDWYARRMYIQSDPDYVSHLKEYGHPSTNGFKDIIRLWKPDHFDPAALLKFYKENGARYFMALANHHDNFDNWNSKYQPWNSVNVGPHMDIVGRWSAAARENGLRFAVSIHADRAWGWYEVAQGADKTGPLAGVPYDGKLTKTDGKGQWWDGLDPQDLYAQNHPKGAPLDEVYCLKFYLRTKQLWDDYQPDMICFDNSVVPLPEAGEQYGLNLYAHFYNTRLDKDGRTEAVVNAKRLNSMQQEAMVMDIERGKADHILPQPWQTENCLGRWQYDREIFEKHEYQSAGTVIRLLADVVSRNGNLMLSVPLQRDGQPDADEIQIVKQIGAWLKINGEAIYATRPWKIYGEGPSTTWHEKAGHHQDAIKAVSASPFTAEDIRFTQAQDGGSLYAIVLALPANGRISVTTLAAGSQLWPKKISSVQLLGGGQLKFTRDAFGLHVTLPEKYYEPIAFALKISTQTN